ncbi:MAG: orotate phosphoribosyltransferase [Prevotellaceae bacterium]|jgi:orotate phosphoribosyltransferase|nr:orotate phosphoribosyltransferase [Prevotellaceae bacterium]
MNTANKTASVLLEIKAVKLSVNKPFTWASGWKSPIYCDNRKILSYPEARKSVCKSFAARIKELYPETEVIAGVATGAIALGIMVAEELNLPFVYVRTAAKDHGLGNLIEGELPERAKVTVIEDLISTGLSSIAAVEALRKAAAEVLGLLAVFSYEFDTARRNFEAAKCDFHTLSNYSTLLKEAVKSNYIEEKDLELLKTWREAPDKYTGTV